MGWFALGLLLIVLSGAAVYGASVVVQREGTGFFDNNTQGKFVRGKTLWDWLQLTGTLAIPILIAAATAILTIQQDRNRRLSEDARKWDEEARANVQRHSEEARADLERELTAERARESALQAYLTEIGQLIREENLGAEPPENEELTTIARRKRILALAQAKTNSILAVLEEDDARRINAIEFLGRAGLITEYGIQMEGANLSSINVWEADMAGAKLSKANLQEVKLPMTHLHESDLGGANLKGADVAGSDLQEVYLGGANLQGADMHWVKLQGASLYKADLQGADLEGAILDDTTILPDGADWTPKADLSRFTDPNHSDFWRSDDPESPAYRGDKDKE